MLAHLTNLTDRAYSALVLAVVLGPVKGAFLVRRAAVNGRMTGRANLKLGELIKLNFYGIVWVTLAQSLGLSCL